MDRFELCRRQCWGSWCNCRNLAEVG